MNSFYVNLQAELADAKEELWVQTQIDGAEAGKKILLKGELKDTDSVFVDEKGERIFQERISRPAKLVICGAGHVSMPIIRMGKMLGFHVTVVEDRPKFADKIINVTLQLIKQKLPKFVNATEQCGSK